MMKSAIGRGFVLLLASGFGALGVGSTAFAGPDPAGGITVAVAPWPDALERRVDRALDGTAATPEQALRIVEILETGLPDQALRSRRAALDREMRDAMAVPVFDPARLEQARRERLALLVAQSRRSTRALVEALAILDIDQRALFLRNWRDRPLQQASRHPNER